MTPDRQQRVSDWAAQRRPRLAFDAMPRPAIVDLSKLDDHELAEITRSREIEFYAALGEVERRRVEKGIAEWNEGKVAAALARKRQGEEIPLRVQISDLPPALFRMGYEWATITFLDLLGSFLARPSPDITEIIELEPAGPGLWRQKKNSTPKVFDPRRRAALDLVNCLQNYTADRQQGFFTTYKLRVTYDPADDQKLVAAKAGEQGGER